MASPVIQFKRGILANLPGLQAGEPGFTTDSYDFYIGLTSETSTNKFFGSHRYWRKETTSTGSGLNLVEGTTNGTDFITLKAPDNLSGIGTYTLPDTNTITDGYFLRVASNGTLSWDTVGGTNGTFTNATLTGVTTVTGGDLKVNTGADFSGITTFSNATNNNLGLEGTGAIQISGGVGIAKNLTVKQNLYVGGHSEFVGVVTFKGGTINLGDSNGDDINVAGEFVSNLIPNADNTYDIGDGSSSKRWRHASFSGIGTFATGLVGDGVQIGISGPNVIDTSSGNLTINSAGGQTIINDYVNIQNNLNVTGNVTIGGTTLLLTGEDIFIKNKDIVIGYGTDANNQDISNDDSANHAGVAIASTIGSPLVSFTASGINTIPDTYKQMMWFKNGTLGFSTDAFGFNYGVAVGTTTMANGVRLAVGSGVTVSDNSVSATNFYGNATSANQIKTIETNADSLHYLTFVDANNGSATNETLQTDDGLYYNPSSNRLYTQHANFAGDVTVSGTLTATITGTATTATRATTVDTTGTTTNSDYYVTFVDTSAGQNGETIRVGTALSVNPSDGSVKTNGILSVGNPAALTSYIKAGGGSNAMYLYGNGDVSFQAKVITNSIRSSSNSNNTISLSDLDATFARNVDIAGITTTGTLRLSGTSGIGITGISASTSLAENSNNYLPTQAAVKAYIDAIDVDDNLGVAGDSGTGTIDLDTQSLTVAGTAGEIETSASGQTITVGLPDTVIVGTALSVPTIKTATIQHRNGTNAATIDTSGNITASQNLTVSGNLYVNGSTTQVNTESMLVEDRTVELGLVNGSAPSSATTWDLGVLFNYNSSGAKKSGVVWEHADGRFKFGSQVSDGGGTDNDSPQITFTAYAPIEIGSLWVNDCAGQSQVISCTGNTRNLVNITIDGGTF